MNLIKLKRKELYMLDFLYAVDISEYLPDYIIHIDLPGRWRDELL